MAKGIMMAAPIKARWRFVKPNKQRNKPIPYWANNLHHQRTEPPTPPSVHGRDNLLRRAAATTPFPAAARRHPFPRRRAPPSSALPPRAVTPCLAPDHWPEQPRRLDPASPPSSVFLPDVPRDDLICTTTPPPPRPLPQRAAAASPSPSAPPRPPPPPVRRGLPLPPTSCRAQPLPPVSKTHKFRLTNRRRSGSVAYSAVKDEEEEEEVETARPRLELIEKPYRSLALLDEYESEELGASLYAKHRSSHSGSHGGGMGMGVMLAGGAAAVVAAYGAHTLSHGGHSGGGHMMGGMMGGHRGYGGGYSHHGGKFKHGKHNHGKFKHGKHDMFGGGGKFKKWK